MAKKAPFPNTIHVSVEGADTRDEYLAVHNADFSDIDDTREVAVYQLVSVGRVAVTKAFEAPTPTAKRR